MPDALVVGVDYVDAMLSRRSQPDEKLLDLMEDAGANVQRAAVLLRDLLETYPESGGLARDLYLCEQQGDRLAHDFIHRMSVLPDGELPFDLVDGYALATGLDDIVDFAEQAADWLNLYAVDATMLQAEAMGAVLVEATRHVSAALAAVRAGENPSMSLVEIHRVENEGDRLFRDAVATLFVGGIDPMVVIRWKDIFASIESAIDACETVGHTIEGITLKRGRP